MAISEEAIASLAKKIAIRDNVSDEEGMKRARRWAKKKNKAAEPIKLPTHGTVEKPAKAPRGAIAPAGPVDPTICFAPSPRCKCVDCGRSHDIRMRARQRASTAASSWNS